MVTLLMSMASIALSACSAPADGSKPLPFHLIDNAVVVSVMVAGEGPFRFLLDTGASRSVVSESVVRRLRPMVITRTRMVTPAGHSIRPVVSVQLTMGGRRPDRVSATVVADEDLAATGVKVDGIVGQDVLASFVYTIDYSKRTISWHTDASVPEGERLPLEFADGRVLVALAHDSGAADSLRLIPDTGSDALVLFARRGRTLPALITLDVALLRSLSGKQLVRRALLSHLSIGTVTLRDHPAIILGEGAHDLPGGDGLLPLHIFSRVTINGPERFMVVQK